MKAISRLSRALFALAVGVSLTAVTAGTASAEPGLSAAEGDNAPLRAAAACPQPGQRVKTSTATNVYLVNPERRLLLIPDEATYFALWDSWDGIAVDDRVNECYSHYDIFDGPHLVRQNGGVNVYIWDNSPGSYRLIPTLEVFEQYGFAWSKVVATPYNDIRPVSYQDWTNY
ncbi:hypothetical protein [Umezawaea sp. Da 62-37]|uniref:hypothetical protein n=1 Tax=Umezawaea sp. Da 62-37 TaxID=3075927 RepID=UPI0028F6E363|nr:hypothetical protein [Umezawaea sp. Da 62-37]WNV86536.1 hypothetical protein RM788_51900 [Umezawaea sp. Da 62-37]